MRTAIIGYSGFVGSNIAAAHGFDDFYRTANIADITGKEYDLVVSAAGRADSHRINNHGAQDRAELEQLADLISSASIGKLVLISTVCIYPWASTADETAPLVDEGLTPYGSNRLAFERRLVETFDTLPVRLPQLYGTGIKKGIVYDLMNDYRVEYIRPQGTFQYYDVGRLWADIEIALDAGIESLNIATPPLTSETIAREVFGRDISGQTLDEPENPFSLMYTRDMRTAHAALYGGAGGYLMTAEQSLEALRRFARS